MTSSIGICEIFASQESLQAYIQGFGHWAPGAFFMLQIAQVILAPIPGNVTAVLGGALFGPGYGFLVSSAGILIGSCIVFGLARRFGKPLVLRFVGEEDFARYNGFFKGRSLAILLLLFLFPFFPKDAFCFLIGLTAIRFNIFLIAILIGRTPGILIATLTGAGLINLSTEVWIALAVPSIVLVILALRYGDKIELWLYKRFKRDKNQTSAHRHRSEQIENGPQSS